jgi:peptidoglycan/xylan/chitin deacetylase (PgdA/CDA1 family)
MIQRIVNKMSRTKSELLFRYSPGLTDFVKSKQNKIIMYHGVDLVGNSAFNTRHTSVDCFERQIQFLTKHCNIISLSDFFKQNFDPTKSNIAITFDDGYLNNFLYAKPILERYKAYATFFITALNQTPETILWADYLDIVSKRTNEPFVIRNKKYQLINGVYYNEDGESIYEVVKNRLPEYSFKKELFGALMKNDGFKDEVPLFDYWKLMNDEQIIETSKSEYISIGSHGYYHNNLGKILINEAVLELTNSKKYLEELTQKKIDSIGYPDGSYSRELIDKAEDLGFSFQLAADGFLFEEDQNDHRILNRKGIYSCDTCGNQLIM